MPAQEALKKMPLEKAVARVDVLEAKYREGKDYVDKGIEGHIRPVVAALIAHGFPTSNSCGGHIEDNLFPWVSFQPAFNAQPTMKSLLCHIDRIIWEMEQLGDFLGEFYLATPWESQDREISVYTGWDVGAKSYRQVAEDYLAMRKKRYVALPDYILECSGGSALRTMPGELIAPIRQTLLDNRREDMLRFGKFLESKL